MTVLFLIILSILSWANDVNANNIKIKLTAHDLETPIQYKISNTFNLASTGTQQSVELTNSLDRIYTGEIIIGTASETNNVQRFNVVFDTGSADLWVFSAYHTCTTASSCVDDWNENFCGAETVCCFFKDIMNDYDNNLSSTYKRFSPSKEWSITYGKGSASGYLSKDSVTIGGLTATDQTFAEATQWSDLLISCVEPMSGILGFAMEAASEDGSNTLIESLHDQNKISSKLFSVSLQGDGDESVLIIGDPDESYFNNHIVYGDVIQPTTTGMWFTQLTGIVTTDNYLLSKDESYDWLDSCTDDAPCLALIDTGTSYITMPSTIYYKLLDYLVSYTNDRRLSSAKCIKYGSDFMCKTSTYSPNDDLPYLWFQLGGYAFVLKPDEYMLTGSDSCAIDYDCMGISYLDSMGDHTYILGDTFLRQYYIVFDESNYRIGLGSNEDELVAAIPRPPVSNFWSYVEVASYIIGGIGVIVCIVASLWKLKKPQNFTLWNNKRRVQQQGNVNINNNNNNNNNNNMIDNNDNNMNNNGDKLAMHREAFLNNIESKYNPKSNIVNVLEIDTSFEDKYMQNTNNDAIDTNDEGINYQQLE